MWMRPKPLIDAAMFFLIIFGFFRLWSLSCVLYTGFVVVSLLARPMWMRLLLDAIGDGNGVLPWPSMLTPFGLISMRREIEAATFGGHVVLLPLLLISVPPGSAVSVRTLRVCRQQRGHYKNGKGDFHRNLERDVFM